MENFQKKLLLKCLKRFLLKSLDVALQISLEKSLGRTSTKIYGRIYWRILSESIKNFQEHWLKKSCGKMWVDFLQCFPEYALEEFLEIYRYPTEMALKHFLNLCTNLFENLITNLRSFPDRIPGAILLKILWSSNMILLNTRYFYYRKFMKNFWR